MLPTKTSTNERLDHLGIEGSGALLVIRGPRRTTKMKICSANQLTFAHF